MTTPGDGAGKQGKDGSRGDDDDGGEEGDRGRRGGSGGGGGTGEEDVRYFDSDFSFEEHAADAFPRVSRYLEGGDAGGGDEDRVVLEVGCGSGSSCVPILRLRFPPREGSDATCGRVLLACDSSPVAVETARRFLEKETEDDGCDVLFRAFVADPGLDEKESESSFPRRVRAAYEDAAASHRPWPADDAVRCVETEPGSEAGTAGVVLLVFVLSAVPPSRTSGFLRRIFRVTKPGGAVCFRDYGLYDLPMMRFSPSSAVASVSDAAAGDVAGDDPVFVRGEGTLARFFSTEGVRDLFERAGFVVVEVRYCTVYNRNRKTGQKLKRVFVHGVFERPAA
ncbi:hypothetical protein ACHAWF_016141 [Thalassiosira exigua]